MRKKPLFDQLAGTYDTLLAAETGETGDTKKLLSRLKIDEGWSYVFVVVGKTETPYQSLASACRAYEVL
jgi:hypothetical protein